MRNILIFNFYVIHSMEIQFIMFHCNVDVFHGGRTGTGGLNRTFSIYRTFGKTNLDRLFNLF